MQFAKELGSVRKALSQKSPEASSQNHENPQPRQSGSRPAFKPDAHPILKSNYVRLQCHLTVVSDTKQNGIQINKFMLRTDTDKPPLHFWVLFFTRSIHRTQAAHAQTHTHTHILLDDAIYQRFPTCAPRSPKSSACTSQGLRDRSRKIK